MLSWSVRNKGSKPITENQDEYDRWVKHHGECVDRSVTPRTLDTGLANIDFLVSDFLPAVEVIKANLQIRNANSIGSVEPAKATVKMHKVQSIKIWEKE